MSATPASVRTPVREHVPSVLVAALSAAFGVGLLQITGFINGDADIFAAAASIKTLF